MRSISLCLLSIFLLAELGCMGRRRGGGGDDDDVVSDGDADSDGDSDVDTDVDVDADGDADADGCLDPDRDDDGYLALRCGGDDCDDLDPTVHPGAADGGSWTSDRIWQNTTYGPVVAVGEDGTAYAAFTIYDQFTYLGSLGYASNIGGRWVGVEIVSGTNTGWAPAIAVDGAGDVHIVFYESANATTVYYVTNATGSWVSRSLGTGYGGTVTLDDAGHPWIAFTQTVNGETALAVATNASGNWVTSTVDDTGTSNGYYPEIALDSAGRAHVAYADYSSGYAVRYATNRNGAWAREQVALDGGDSLGIAIDAGDDAHVVYGGWDNNGTVLGVRHASNASGAWVIEAVDADGISPDVAIDASDALHVVYTNQAYSAVRYATNVTGRWVTESLTNAAGTYYSPDSALGGGQLHAVFQDTGASHTSRSVPDRIDQNCDGIAW